MFPTGRALSIWSVLCVALALGSAALPQPAASPVAFPLRAIHIAGNWGTNELVVDDWHAGRTHSLVPADYLAWLGYLNVNWVGISVALTYDDSLDSTVERNREHASGEDASFSDDALRQMIRDLDVVGVSAWFPLTDAPPVTVMSVEQAQPQYERIFTEHLVPLAARNPGRPIVFLEYGALDHVETPAAPDDPAEFPELSSRTRTATESTTGAKPRPMSMRACSAPWIGIPASSTACSGGAIGLPATSAGESSGRTYGRIPYAPSPAKRSFGRPIASTPSTITEASLHPRISTATGMKT